jgi:hypothetical protein
MNFCVEFFIQRGPADIISFKIGTTEALLKEYK